MKNFNKLETICCFLDSCSSRFNQSTLIVTAVYTYYYKKSTLKDFLNYHQITVNKLSDFFYLTLLLFTACFQLNGTFYDVDYLETWEAMIAMQKKGLAKSIGVSNFNKAMLERLISKSTVKPANLQVEVKCYLSKVSIFKLIINQ